LKIVLFTFASARDELGFARCETECLPEESPRGIFARVAPAWSPPPGVRVALDNEFAEWDQPVGEAQELAVIPPVSGG